MDLRGRSHSRSIPISCSTVVFPGGAIGGWNWETSPYSERRDLRRGLLLQCLHISFALILQSRCREVAGRTVNNSILSESLQHFTNFRKLLGPIFQTFVPKLASASFYTNLVSETPIMPFYSLLLHCFKHAMEFPVEHRIYNSPRTNGTHIRDVPFLESRAT